MRYLKISGLPTENLTSFLPELTDDHFESSQRILDVASF